MMVNISILNQYKKRSLDKMKKILILITMLASKDAYARQQYIGLDASRVSSNRENIKDTSSSTTYENLRTTGVNLNLMYGVSLHKNLALQVDLGFNSKNAKKYKGEIFQSSIRLWDVSLGPSLVFSLKPNDKINPLVSLGGGFITNGSRELDTRTQDYVGYKLYAQAGLGVEVAIKNSSVKYRPMIAGRYTYFGGDNKKVNSPLNTSMTSDENDSRYSWSVIFTPVSFTVAF